MSSALTAVTVASVPFNTVYMEFSPPCRPSLFTPVFLPPSSSSAAGQLATLSTRCRFLAPKRCQPRRRGLYGNISFIFFLFLFRRESELEDDSLTRPSTIYFRDRVCWSAALQRAVATRQNLPDMQLEDAQDAAEEGRWFCSAARVERKVKGHCKVHAYGPIFQNFTNGVISSQDLTINKTNIEVHFIEIDNILIYYKIIMTMTSAAIQSEGC